MNVIDNKIYLIDGSGFIFRAYHALPSLTRSDSIPVGAVLGFCNILLKLLDNNIINKMAVVFDSKRKNYRHDIYPEYKANRSETPEDLIPQFALIREACKVFSIPQVELEGYEADDIIATYATQAKQKGYSVVIVSSDKDLMQLVNKHVKMLDPIKNKIIDYPEVEKKFFSTPDKVIDIQALAGDSSDNVPGVPNIGIKTAAQLINEFGTLEELLQQLDKIKQPKRRQNLIDFKDNALISKKLVTLSKDVPLNLDVDSINLEQPDSQKLYSFLKKQEFHNLIGRMLQKGFIKKNDIPNDSSSSVSDNIVTKLQNLEQRYYVIKTVAELEKWLAESVHLGLISFKTEVVTSKDNVPELTGFSLALKPGLACYVPLKQAYYQKQDNFQKAITLLGKVLSNNNTTIVGSNIKHDMKIMLNYGIEINAYEDIVAMSYGLDGIKYKNELPNLALKYFNHRMIIFKEIDKNAADNVIPFESIDIDKFANYFNESTDFVLRLSHVLQYRVANEKCNYIYRSIDLPLLKILALMEYKGICVNNNYLKQLDTEFSASIKTLSQEIYEFAGKEFNIASPKQLGEVLFMDLQLPHGKKGKSGIYSTDISVLEKLLEQGCPIAQKLIEWRKYSKLQSTYTEGLLARIDDNNRVHTNYGLNTLSGRLSSSDPNLQNIPIRTTIGKKIRKAFIAENGYKIISLDYSQIELRLLAHVANIDSLITCFKNNEDIHKKTASEIFKIPLESVDSKTRYAAKAINFGIIYGISAFGLSKQLGISRIEASDYIDNYKRHYPGIIGYMEQQKEFARKNGYVKTILNRKCYIQNINSSNFIQRSFAERQAINAPLQGSAADLIKKAMNELTQVLAKYNIIKTQPKQLDLNFDKIINTNPIKIGNVTLPEGVNLGMPVKKEIKSVKNHSNGSVIHGPYYCNYNGLVGNDVRLLLQIHDELILEAKDSIVTEIIPELKKIMENTLYLKVPITVNYSVGNSWCID